MSRPLEKSSKRFAEIKNLLIFAPPKRFYREHSSAGSEHLPYKQRVRGSNPFAPTKHEAIDFSIAFFVVLITYSIEELQEIVADTEVVVNIGAVVGILYYQDFAVRDTFAYQSGMLLADKIIIAGHNQCRDCY